MTDPRPVLVVTSLTDPTSDLVIEELHGRGVPVVRLDPGEFPHSVSVSARVTARGVEGTISTHSRTTDLSRVRSLYYRRPSGFSFPGLDEQAARFAVAQARHGLGGVLASLPGCLYVNHPHRIGDAEFKPSGLAVAVSSGFAVPPTLITSDPATARDFVRENAPVVHKPLSSQRVLAGGVASALGVQAVTADELDDSVAGTAHLFQQQVDKVADVRVTVVGAQCFAVRIDSDLLDWRTDYSRLGYEPVRLPPGIRESLHRYLRHFGLVFGAFDFALDRAGQWWFLECNPSGQWYWLEHETGLPMLAATADLLERVEGAGQR